MPYVNLFLVEGGRYSSGIALSDAVKIHLHDSCSL